MAAVQVCALVAYAGFLLATFGWRTFQAWRKGRGTSWRGPVSVADAVGETTCLLACLLTLAAPPLAWTEVVDPLRTGWTGLQAVAGAGVMALGTALAIRAQRHLGREWRAGVEPSGTLVTTGPFARVRHPFYLGWCLASGAVLVAVPSAVSVAGFVLHGVAAEIIVRTVEEPVLARTHGAAYTRYQARTGRFIPRLWPGGTG